LKERNEDVRRIIDLPDTLARRGGDPFAIDVSQLLGELRGTKGNKTTRLILEAQALNSVSKVVKYQEEWVIEALRGIKIDPQLIREKLDKMQVKDIARLLARDIYPCMGIRRISGSRIRDALDYFSLTEPWGRAQRMGSVVFRNRENTGINIEEIDLERESEELYGKIREKLEDGPMDYSALIGASDNPLLTAYCIAQLSSAGRIAIRKDPLANDISIIKALEGGSLVSVAIRLPRVQNKAGRA
jgi:hypothetical protein